MLWKSSECQRPAQSSPRSSSRSRKSRPWSVQQARKEAARKRVRGFTEYRHSFTPSAGGGAQGQVRRWWHSQTTGLGSQGLIPLSIRLSSFGRREDDRPSWLSGSDSGSDRVLMMTSVSQVHHSQFVLYCCYQLRVVWPYLLLCTLSLSPLASMGPALNQSMTSLLFQTHPEAQQ